MEAVSSRAGPPQEGLPAVELEGALDAKELDLRTSFGLESENLNLRAEASRSRGSVETFGRKKRERLMPTQDISYLTSRCKNT